MKTLTLAASAVLLLAAPGLSLAQDEHHGEGRPGGGAHIQAPPAQAPRPAGPRQGGPALHNQGPPQFHGGQPQGGQPQGGQVQERRSFQDRPGFQGGERPQGLAGGGQPNGANRPQGFVNGQAGRGDFRPDDGRRGGGFNPGERAPRPGSQAFGYGGHQYFRYRAAPYRFPGGYYGWSNHSWRRGEWLPPVFITSSYFINDWYDFGLWQPDYGYQWIRVGADAVLINLADGQVVDVVPGVYYY